MNTNSNTSDNASTNTTSNTSNINVNNNVGGDGGRSVNSLYQQTQSCSNNMSGPAMTPGRARILLNLLVLALPPGQIEVIAQ